MAILLVGATCIGPGKGPLVEVAPITITPNVELEADVDITGVHIGPDLEVENEGDATASDEGVAGTGGVVGVIGGGGDSIGLWLAILAGPLSYPLMRTIRKKVWKRETTQTTGTHPNPNSISYVVNVGCPNCSGEIRGSQTELQDATRPNDAGGPSPVPA